MNLFRGLMQRRWSFVLGFLSILVGGAIAVPRSPSLAVQFEDGTTVFTTPPRLVDFVTLENTAGHKDVTYYVTVNLLPEAGEPLKTLRVSLIEGRFTRLDYDTDDIQVFMGNRENRQTTYLVEQTQYDEDSQTLTVQLAEPAEPGQMITFALDVVRNPAREGVYLFEVSAAPAGEKPRFQRIGTGRLNIYADQFFGWGND